MDLWKRLSGSVRLRLTSADCLGRLRALSREIQLEDVRWNSELTAEFRVARRDAKHIAVREGETLELLEATGYPAWGKRIWQWKYLIAWVLVLGLATAWLPGRLLFFTVEGNGDIPARLVLEAAEEAGLYFGASRRAVRSEKVKNHLLYAIPELRWAGVNTNGCNAAITVRPRSLDETAEALPDGDIVAVRDGVVTEIFPEAGTVLVKPGQAVRAGQILISGSTDVGLLTRTDRASGEVYGLTRREISAKLPESVTVRRKSGGERRRFALLIGKKRIYFTNDSGILDTTCGKMVTVNYLELPGGFRLPVALVTECYTPCETAVTGRAGEDQLLSAARDYALETMRAGTILGETASLDGNSLRVVYECRELLGAFRPGVFWESETNDDREIGERGAG